MGYKNIIAKIKQKKLAGIILLGLVIIGIFAYFMLSKMAKPVVYNERDEVVYLENKKGPLVIFVWSSGCGSCVYSLPHIKILKEKLEAKNGKLLLVLVDDNQQLKQTAKAHFIRFEVPEFTTLHDKGEKFMKYYDIKVTPTLLIFDKNGKLLEKREGGVPWGNPDQLEVISKILKIDL